MFKVNNKNTRIKREVCSKLTIKTSERRHWRRSGVFIVNFEHISHLVLVFLFVHFEHVIVGWDDPLCDTISSSTDLHLDDLMEIAELEVSMAASHRKRVRSLTKDTSTVLEHTCKRLVELVQYLLAKPHSYFLLGKVTTDPLERAFDKLRQGSEGTHFLLFSCKRCIDNFLCDTFFLTLQKDSCLRWKKCMEASLSNAFFNNYCRLNTKFQKKHGSIIIKCIF